MGAAFFSPPAPKKSCWVPIEDLPLPEYEKKQFLDANSGYTVEIVGGVVMIIESGGTATAIGGNAVLHGFNGLSTMFSSDRDSALVNLSEALGLSKADAQRLENVWDAGTIVVDLGAAGKAILTREGGKVRMQKIAPNDSSPSASGGSQGVGSGSNNPGNGGAKAGPEGSPSPGHEKNGYSQDAPTSSQGAASSRRDFTAGGPSNPDPWDDAPVNYSGSATNNSGGAPSNSVNGSGGRGGGGDWVDDLASGNLFEETLDEMILLNPRAKPYQTRIKAEVAELRHEFNQFGRREYLQNLARDESALRARGFDDTAIEDMKDGIVPEGYEVHHKKPLYRGGTNDLENLDLIDKAFHRKNFDAFHYYEPGLNPYGID